MAGPTDLFDLCAEWLDVCAAAVATGPGGSIDRAFVSPGAPAFDCCPQLTVHAGGPIEGDTAPLAPPLAPGQRADVGAVNLVMLTATVIRCVPTLQEDGELPEIAAMSAAAEALNADVWAIWHHTRQGKSAGTLFASPSGTRELFLDAAASIAPQGGCSGWQIPIRVALPGYVVAA